MSDLQRLLGDAATRFFADAWKEGLRSFDTAHWERALDIGLPRVMLPESQGGADCTWRDVQGVFHAAGRFASSLPLGDTVLAGRILAAGGATVPTSPLGLSVRCTGEIRRTNGELRFRGETAGVCLYPSTELVVAVIDTGDSVSAIVLDPVRARNILTGQNLAGESRVRLIFEEAPVKVVESADLDLRNLLNQCALLRCAQISGALVATLERSLDYATNRKQFGRAIGQFQSVRQALALLTEEVMAVDAACSAAFLAADHGDCGFEVACAKLRANEAIGVATAIAHQVHGAIGFTQEFDLRHFTQRLLSWRTEYGNDQFWAKRLGSLVSSRGADDFWSDITTRGDAIACLGIPKLNQ
jgi:acyl-CoA dehydrogenase